MFDRPEEPKRDRFSGCIIFILYKHLACDECREKLSPRIAKLYLDQIVIVIFKYDRFVVILDCSSVDKVKTK